MFDKFHLENLEEMQTVKVKQNAACSNIVWPFV